jgi:hypothetical protein
MNPLAQNFIAPSKMDEYDQYDPDSLYYGRTPMTDEQIEEKTRIVFEANTAIYGEEAPELSKHVQQVNKAPRTVENDIRSVGRVLADKDVSSILPVLRGAGTDINSPAYQNLGQPLLADGVEKRPTWSSNPPDVIPDTAEFKEENPSLWTGTPGSSASGRRTKSLLRSTLWSTTKLRG